MTRRFPFVELLLLVTPFVIWSFAFVALYALHALGCARGWPPEVARGGLVAAWLGHAALAGGFLAWARGRPAAGDAWRFVRDATAGLALAGAVGTLWVGLPVILNEMCGG